MRRRALLDKSYLLHRVWWAYGDGWPYELPEDRRWWVPGWLNNWLGRTGSYPMWVWRWACWLDGRHENDTYGDCVVCRKSLKGDV